ncbi:hypothetical protein [Rubritalea tangerina]|uniref:Uncharacterized protein n=1 Tax=Rubritalea tangerina TaxID=430798 RepID=A0ABW4ZE35_9BACT
MNIKHLALLTSVSLLLPSCMTTYDRHGRPVQSVDPGLAAVGVVGAGLLGAAIANSNKKDDHHHRHHRPVHHEPVHCHH